MDLITRTFIPIVSKDGMNIFPILEFSEINSEGYTYNQTQERFDYLEELKKSCLFGVSGVLTAFSNVIIDIIPKLTIGRITQIKLNEIIPPAILEDHNLKIIASSNFAAIQGNLGNHECVFPYFQFHSGEQINITCSAFSECPNEYSPQCHYTFYMGFASDDPAIQLLQKSISEFSKNNTNFAIVFLYVAVEVALRHLSGEKEGKLSCLITKISRKIKIDNNDLSKKLSGMKRRIEKHIVKKRGNFAHAGLDLKQDDLLKSYETALEFFWYYGEFKKYCS